MNRVEPRDLLRDAFGRIEETFAQVAHGLDAEALNARVAPGANPIAWLLWHLARIQDDHVAELAGEPQAWESWRERFSLPLDEHDTGYGHGEPEVGAVRIDDAGLLTGYHADVHALTLRYLDRVDAAELDRVVDTRWDPPVTAGVRLISVEGDCLQHLGQAAYLKGLLG
ncbi:DinB family protein [Nocardioides sp.]|uniref:mycothiol transferase n=1 Tax=Nocardioides sp. TaxID=35761 RepID=UPI002736489E|nr:DinB family protein [Nocardioides sp.]MDP3890971.1 DinB family protein [Nocardioides sp.]